MRKTLAVLFLLASASAVMAQDTTVEDLSANIKANCSAEWPGDYVMQKWCVDQQIEAGGKLAETAKSDEIGADETQIVRSAVSLTLLNVRFFPQSGR